jgi:glucose-6-phosphate 1-epimerase
MSYDIDDLNARYSIADELVFIRGKGGLPFIQVSTEKSRATISLLGGQLLSYMPAGAKDDLFFVSENAYYQAGKSIKGGVPVCWPWFAEGNGDKSLPFHGFARTAAWEMATAEINSDRITEIVLRLADSEQTRKLWPYPFVLEERIFFGETLRIELVSRNTGDEPFHLTQALHTYFNVGDITAISVHGLENHGYLDKVDRFLAKEQQGQITIDREVDRIYQNVSAPLLIDDPVLERKIEIEHTGSSTAVVWNPWTDISKRGQDLVDDDYTRFVCVETANAASDIVTVMPGDQHLLGVTYRLRQI